MTSTDCIVFLQAKSDLDTQLCLSATVTDQGRMACCVTTYDSAETEHTWVITPALAGNETRGYYLMHKDTALFAHFGDDDSVHLTRFDVNSFLSPEYFMFLDSLGDGFVAINNHNHSRVMDAAGNNPASGAPVAPFEWNSGANQRWRIIPTSMIHW